MDIVAYVGEINSININVLFGSRILSAVFGEHHLEIPNPGAVGSNPAGDTKQIKELQEAFSRLL